jgi:hypothetical protein
MRVAVLAVRVHPDSGARVVRWRDQDLRRRRGFGSQAGAPAFAEGLKRGLHSWLPEGGSNLSRLGREWSSEGRGPSETQRRVERLGRQVLVSSRDGARRSPAADGPAGYFHCDVA